MTDPEEGILPIDPRPMVLVVDAEPTRRMTVTRMVRGLGYRVRSCPGGREALAFVREHPGVVALLLVDLPMPRMDGGELVERMREVEADTEVVLMATPGDAQAAELLAGYPDVACLAQPITFGDLARLLEDRLGPAFQLPISSRPSRSPGRHLRGSHQQSRRSGPAPR
jgi:CheY-like chemotaxis protein